MLPAGVLVARNQLVTHLLHTIKDPSYDNIVTILSTNKDGIEFEAACISLIEFEAACIFLIEFEVACISLIEYSQ